MPTVVAARATGLLTKVGSDLDAACGAVGAAVASDVRGEYTQSAPPFVRFHSHRGDKGATHALTGRAPPLPAATTRALLELRLLELQGCSPKLAVIWMRPVVQWEQL